MGKWIVEVWGGFGVTDSFPTKKRAIEYLREVKREALEQGIRFKKVDDYTYKSKDEYGNEMILLRRTDDMER